MLRKIVLLAFFIQISVEHCGQRDLSIHLLQKRQSAQDINDVPEEKYQFSDCISDTLFVVDSTSSVRNFFENHRDYVFRTVSQLQAIGDEGTRIGVIVYSSSLKKKVKIPFGDHKNQTDILKAIKGLPYFSGITATGSALKFAVEALKNRRANVPTNVVVITDGFSYDLVEDPSAELHRLPNVRTFAVTVTDSWREYDLLTIAGSPHRVFKGMNSIGELVTALSSCNGGPRRGDVFGHSPTEHQPKYEAPRTEAPITTRHTGATTAAPRMTPATPATLEPNPCYYPDQPGVVYHTASTRRPEPIATRAPVTAVRPVTAASIDVPRQAPRNCLFDVVLVLDSSGSLQSRFQKQLEVAIRLINKLEIGPDDARVALIKYAGRGKSRVVFPISKYADKQSLENAVKRIVFIGGTTFTNEALLKAGSELSGPDGHRPSASPVVIVFTDGYSQEDPASGAEALHRRGIPVYAVGINDIFPVNEKELLVIAGEKSRVFLDKNIADFERELDYLTRNCLKRSV